MEVKKKRLTLDLEPTFQRRLKGVAALKGVTMRHYCYTGNPPWIDYNQTVSTLRTELERQSRNADYDPENRVHAAVSEAGKVAAEGAAQRLAHLCQERDQVTVIIARREIRKWLRESAEGRAVEEAVRELLGKRAVGNSRK